MSPDLAPAPRDPEARMHARESAESGTFEVVIRDGNGTELGTLDDTFSNDFDASTAAYDAQIPDVGVTADIRRVND